MVWLAFHIKSSLLMKETLMLVFLVYLQIPRCASFSKFICTVSFLNLLNISHAVSIFNHFWRRWNIGLPEMVRIARQWRDLCVVNLIIFTHNIAIKKRGKLLEKIYLRYSGNFHTFKVKFPNNYDNFVSRVSFLILAIVSSWINPSLGARSMRVIT